MLRERYHVVRSKNARIVLHAAIFVDARTMMPCKFMRLSHGCVQVRIKVKRCWLYHSKEYDLPKPNVFLDKEKCALDTLTVVIASNVVSFVAGVSNFVRPTGYLEMMPRADVRMVFEDKALYCSLCGTVLLRSMRSRLSKRSQGHVQHESVQSYGF